MSLRKAEYASNPLLEWMDSLVQLKPSLMSLVVGDFSNDRGTTPGRAGWGLFCPAKMVCAAPSPKFVP